MRARAANLALQRLLEADDDGRNGVVGEGGFPGADVQLCNRDALGREALARGQGPSCAGRIGERGA